MRRDEVVAIRNKLGLSRGEFAKLLGTSYETLCRWENGRRAPSKAYQAKIREAGGEVSQDREEYWIFRASHIRRVLHYVAKAPGLIFGIVEALVDPAGRVYLAAIRVVPNAHSFLDVERYFLDRKRLAKNGDTGIAGCFIAGDNMTRPPKESLLPFVQRIGSHFVLCDRTKKWISVWRLGAPSVPERGRIAARQLRHFLVGTKDEGSNP